MYANLTRGSTASDSAGFRHYTSVIGASLSLAGQIVPIPGQSVQIMAGAGLFEVAAHDYNNDLAEGLFDKETMPGYIIGAGLRRKLGRLAATFEGRYLILNHGLAPNTLQFLVGLELL
jgi:hypothetical protein